MIRSDIPRTKISNHPGVYLFKTTNNTILYIWKAKQLKKRLQHYFTPSTLRKQDMVAKAGHVELLPVTNEQEALLLETNLIRTHKPIYNNLIKGETSYVYIKIPHEPYPNILLTRYKKNDKATYIGPKVRKRELKNVLQLIRHLLKYRACTPTVFKKGHVCSDYFFDLCAGRCAYHHQKTHESNQQAWFKAVWTPSQAQQEYQQIIQSIIAYFKGYTKPLEKTIRHHIDQAIALQNFERAAKLRDMSMTLQEVTEQQSISLESDKTGIYVMIIAQPKRFIRWVISLVQGKISDVITWKENQDDSDLVWLFKTIEREYEHSLTPIQKEDTIRVAHATQSKAFNKKEQKQLGSHLTRFLEGYLHEHHLDDQEVTATHYLLESLQKKYHLPALPVTIECTDISHFGGDWTSGAISSMQDGRLHKKWYRHYKITTAGKHDDYAALAELLVRRSHAKIPWPDVFIIDGGVGQLGVVKTLLQQDEDFAQTCRSVTFVSLEKGKARTRAGKQAGSQEVIHLLHENFSVESTPMSYDDADKLLIMLRDEAHRFANRYRKRLMRNDLTNTETETTL